MSRYIKFDAIKTRYRGGFHDDYVVDYDSVMNAPSIDLVRCAECKKVREDGGHANCNGYLYCKKWKTLVDEDCFCSWGEREGE